VKSELLRVSVAWRVSNGIEKDHVAVPQG